MKKSSAKRRAKGNNCVPEDAEWIGEDMRRLEIQAFDRLEMSGDVIMQYGGLRRGIPAELASSVHQLYLWFLCPITLWPFNLHDLLQGIFRDLRARRSLKPTVRAIMEFLPPLPSPEIVEAVVAHEHDVQRGCYEQFNKVAEAKFAPAVKDFAGRTDFQEDWAIFKKHFHPDKWANPNGIIRRTLSPERNLRENFRLDSDSQRDLFQAAFDTFCLKWNLYGMQGDTPLLQKISVNLTPHGTMIFIPSYWSIDHRRDLDWKQIAVLHRKRTPKRMGPALAEGRQARRRKYAKLLELTKQADHLGLRGQKRTDFLLAGLKLDPRTDPKQLIRLRKEFAGPP